MVCERGIDVEVAYLLLFMAANCFIWCSGRALYPDLISWTSHSPHVPQLDPWNAVPHVIFIVQHIHPTNLNRELNSLIFPQQRKMHPLKNSTWKNAHIKKGYLEKCTYRKIPHGKMRTWKEFHMDKYAHRKNSTVKNAHIERIPHEKMRTWKNTHIEKIPHGKMRT